MKKSILIQFKKMLFFLAFFSCFAAFAQTTTFYNFNTPGDLTTYFTRGNTSPTLITQSPNTGIGGSGAVFIGNQAANEVYTTKQGYSNGGVGSVYEFSTFIKSEFNSGYSAIGFTSLPNQPHATNGNPSICLGVSVHGGGFIFYNNSTSSFGNWTSGGIVNASVNDLLNNGSPDKWYKIILKITAQANNNYHLQVEIWPSNANGVLLHSTASAIHTRTYQNNNIGNSTVLYSYFGFGGYRVSNFDNYALNLQGSTVIDAGAPVVVNGTAVLSPILNNSIDIEGNVTDDRGITVTEKGFVWNTSGTPTVSDNKIAYGSGLGSFNGTINNLAPGTYYLRAYAINANGVSYGTERIVIVPTQEGEIFTTTSNLDFNLCPDSSELVKTFTVSATGIGSNISLSGVNGFSYSLDNNNFSSTLTINSVSGQVNTTTVYVKFLNSNSSSNGILTLSATNALGRSIALNGVVLSTSINSQPTVTNQTVCRNSTPQTLSITANGATAFQWFQNSSDSITGATLINGATSTSYTLPNSNAGTVYYFARITFGDCATLDSNIVSQTVLSTVGNISWISGPSVLSAESTVATYSVTAVSGATSYVWNLPSGLTLTSQTGPTVTVAVASNFTNGDLSVYALNSCGETVVRNVFVTKAVALPGGISFAITGSSIICANTVETYSATAVLGGSYIWSVPAGVTITSGQGTNSITVSVGGTFVSGQVGATCVTSDYTFQDSYLVSGSIQPSTITGPVNLCSLSTATYSVATIPGVSYLWSVPLGMSIISGEGTSSITVSISASSSGSISVRTQSLCGLSAPSVLSVNTAPVLGRITGITRVCGAVQTTVDSNGVIVDNTALNSYTYRVAPVAGVSSYIWTVPSGVIIESGQGTNALTVSYDLSTFTTGTLTVQGVNSCGTGSLRSLVVSVVSGTITGPTSLCSMTTASYSIPSDLGNNFVWSLPQGMSIISGTGTSSITVSLSHPINFATSNQVRVTFTTACGGEQTLSLPVNCSAYTSLSSGHCGATSVSPMQWLDAMTVSGANGYRFNIYDASGTTLITSIDRPFYFFRFSQFNFEYGTTYQVRVQLKQGEVYGSEGATCSVTLMTLPTTTLAPSVCGATGVSPSQWLDAIAVSGASGYRFNIYESTGTTLLSSIDRPVSFFRLSQMSFTYGVTYQVKVQVKQGDVYGLEGASCSVSTVAISTTTLAPSVCGATGVSPSQWLDAIAVSGASGYRFNIYEATGTTLLASIDRPVSFFRFLQMNFEYGATYQVKVQVKQGEVYGAEGTACSVTTISLPVTSLSATVCGATNISPSQWLDAVAVSGASGYRFNIYEATGTTLITSIDRPVSFFRFSQMDFEYGTAYQVGVQVKQGDIYGLEGKQCRIVVVNDEFSRQTSMDDDESTQLGTPSSPLVLVAYPNPFSTSFVLRPLEGVDSSVTYQVYDITGKLLESRAVSSSEIGTHTIGENYPSGMYLAIATQGDTRQTFKMIKR